MLNDKMYNKGSVLTKQSVPDANELYKECNHVGTISGYSQ